MHRHLPRQHRADRALHLRPAAPVPDDRDPPADDRALHLQGEAPRLARPRVTAGRARTTSLASGSGWTTSCQTGPSCPSTTAPRAPTPPPRSGRGWPARRWRSRSTGSCATSRARCRRRTAPTRPSSRSSPTAAGRRRSQLVRHDAAHVLAAAMLELYPGVKISIGPAIENGFYYDFDFPDGRRRSTTRTSRAIEAAMKAAHRRRRAVRARGRQRAGRAAALPRGEAALQGRADRGPDQERGRRPPSRSTPTARSPTCAAARTRPPPSASRRSSSSRWPAPTGAATPTARCSRASMAPPSSPTRTSRRI